MTTCFWRMAALALLGTIACLGLSPTAAMADGAACCGHSCGNCCPHCGCCLVPECHVYWTTKKVTTYKYTCICEWICVPDVTPLCDKCNDCRDCKCRLHQVRRLVKIPCVKEEPVKACTVEWVCPHCNGQGG